MNKLDKKYKNSIFIKSLQSLYTVDFTKIKSETHKSVIEAIYYVLVMDTENYINEAKLQLAIDTAEGEWLDYWGAFFNVARLDGETDADYRQRLLDSALAPTVTIKALKQATANYLSWNSGISYTSEDIQIIEPFKKLARLSLRGTLSGDAMLWSPGYYTHGVIQINIPDSRFLGTNLIQYIKTIKASGVQIIWGITSNWDIIDDFFTHCMVLLKHLSYVYLWIRDVNVNDALTMSFEDIPGNSRLSEHGYLTGHQLIYTDFATYYKTRKNKKSMERDYVYSDIWSGNSFISFFNKDEDSLTIKDIFEKEYYEGRVFDDFKSLANIPMFDIDEVLKFYPGKNNYSLTVDDIINLENIFKSGKVPDVYQDVPLDNLLDNDSLHGKISHSLETIEVKTEPIE